MRALSFRSATGEASALVNSDRGWEVRRIRLDTEAQEMVYRTLGDNLFVIIDADPLGNMLRINGQHGAIKAELVTADETALKIVQGNRELAIRTNDQANRVWVEEGDGGLVFNARSRQR